MRRDDDGFGPVSRAERRAAEAFWTAFVGRRTRPRRYTEALALPMPRPPLIERTYTPPPEPPTEDPTPFCGFTGPKGAAQTLDQLRADIVQVAKAQWTAWHTTDAVPRPRLENDVALFWLLVAYYVSANAKITADQVKALHAAAKPVSFAALVAPTLTKAKDIDKEAEKLRDLLLKGIASPGVLETPVFEAIKNARESHFDTKSGPWSAVFVSSVVRGAMIGWGLETDPTEPLFVSVNHIGYVLKALERKGPPGVPGTYHAFGPGTRDAAVGDIIVLDRRPMAREASVEKLDPKMDKTLISHGDIVVEVKGDHVVTIGGNVCNSVRLRHYPANSNRLVVDRNQLFVQENSKGVIPPLPAEACHDATDLLESQSTKRIVALLSLVKDCPAPPAGAKS